MRGDSLYARITLCTNHFMHENFYARSLYARITLCTKIFMHGQVNVIQINGVFSTFLLQTVLLQYGSYYLIGTEVESDIVLPDISVPVNILSCARPLMVLF
jgi:hypothetical protein